MFQNATSHLLPQALGETLLVHIYAMKLQNTLGWQRSQHVICRYPLLRAGLTSLLIAHSLF